MYIIKSRLGKQRRVASAPEDTGQQEVDVVNIAREFCI